MLIDTLFIVIGILTFLFVFWKRLREDYVVSQIFTTSFYIIIGIIVGYVLSVYFFYAWFFWVSLVAAISSMFLGIFKYKLSLVEIFEAVVLGLLTVFALFLFHDLISKGNVLSGVGGSVIFLLLIVFFFLDSRYRRFSWYKSGRVGFSGLTISGAFFLLRAVVAVTFGDVISFVGNIDAYLSAIVAFLSFLVLFNLARQKT